MKVELHLHTSRYSGCATNTAEELMEHLVSLHYDAVYITEHDQVWSAEDLYELQAKFPDIRIFPGVELARGHALATHLLVLGTNDPGYLGVTNVDEIIARAEREGHATVLAHPFRWDGGAALLDGLHLPDAIEYHTNNQDGAASRKAAAKAKDLDLPIVNAGDTHGRKMAGRFWIETARPVEQADGIRAIIRERAFRNCSS